MMQHTNEVTSSESKTETLNSHQTQHEEQSSSSKETRNCLRLPDQSLKRSVSTESLYSGSDVSEHFVSYQPHTGHDQRLLRMLSDDSADLNDIPEPSAWRAWLGEFWIVNYGAFLVLVSQFFGAGMNVCTRLLETPGTHGEPMHPFQILFARQSITTLITTVYALWTKSIPHFPLGPPGKVRLLLVCRGLFGFLGVFGLYFSLLYLPISEATILTFLSPIGSCVAFAILIPGETFSRQQMLAGMISLLGVVFIARPVSLFSSHVDSSVAPHLNVTMSANGTMVGVEAAKISQPTPTEHLQAVGVAMIGVVGAIGALTAIRSIGQRAHALLSVNYFSAWCTFVSLAALLVVPSVKFRLPGNVLEWGLLSILGLAGFVMQLLLTQGMAYGGARATTKADSSDLEMQPRATEPQPNATDIQVRSVDRIRGYEAKTVPRARSSGAKATSMLYTQMLFALTSDKIIFGVTPGVWSWVGSGLILLGAIWVAAESGPKSIKTDPERLPTEAHRRMSHSKDSHTTHEAVGLLSNFDEESSSGRRPDLTPRASTER